MPETGLSPIVKGKIWCAGAQQVPRGMGCSSQHAVKEAPRPEMIESRCHLMRQKNAKSNLLHLRVRTCTCLGTESWTSVNWRFQQKTFQNNSMGYLLFFTGVEQATRSTHISKMGGRQRRHSCLLTHRLNTRSDAHPCAFWNDTARSKMLDLSSCKRSPKIFK